MRGGDDVGAVIVRRDLGDRIHDHNAALGCAGDAFLEHDFLFAARSSCRAALTLVQCSGGSEQAGTGVQVVRRMLAAISSGSKTRFQSSRISIGLPKVIALLQSSE